jgi:hypothetical protein
MGRGSSVQGIETENLLTKQLKEESPFPARRAFVVQFYAEAVLEPGNCAGRVEHVVSGQATHFASVEELMAFIRRILNSVSAQPPDEF